MTERKQVHNKAAGCEVGPRTWSAHPRLIFTRQRRPGGLTVHQSPAAQHVKHPQRRISLFLATVAIIPIPHRGNPLELGLLQFFYFRFVLIFFRRLAAN